MDNNRITGADLLLHCLSQVGIRRLFGFPGESTLPIAVAASKLGINHTLASCERCAGYMADGFARFSGTVPFVYAPGGIGSPHILPALLEARNSSIPIIFLSTSSARSTAGRWATSTFDHRAFSSSAKACYEIRTVEQIPQVVSDAARTASAPRTGPVHIDISQDLLEVDAPTFVEREVCANVLSYPSHRPAPDKKELHRAVELFRKANRVFFVLGGGAQLTEPAPSLYCRLLARTGANAVSTLNGKGALLENTPGYVGVIGQKGHAQANALTQQCDLVILLGTKMGDKSSLNWTLLDPGQAVIQVDVDASEIGRAFPVNVGVLSDVSAFCEVFMRQLDAENIPAKSQIENHPVIAWNTKGMIGSCYKILSDSLFDSDVLIADASQACGWMGVAFQSRLESRGTASPRGTGSIGYALPAALGAALARPTRKVVAVGGDGGLLMAMHEMETAARLALPITFVLLNNDNRLGLLEMHLEHFYGAKGVLGRRMPVNWAAICAGFGWGYARVESEARLHEVLPESLRSNLPTLVDLAIGAEVSPDFETAKRIRPG